VLIGLFWEQGETRRKRAIPLQNIRETAMAAVFGEYNFLESSLSCLF